MIPFSYKNVLHCLLDLVIEVINWNSIPNEYVHKILQHIVSLIASVYFMVTSS